MDCSRCAKRPADPGYKTCKPCRTHERLRKHPRRQPLEPGVGGRPARELHGPGERGLEVRPARKRPGDTRQWWEVT